MRANKRDANEKEIVEFWRACGYIWIPMVPGQGFDGLLIHHGKPCIVEIKNPETDWHLTPDEYELSQRICAQGGEYHIVECLDGAAHLVGLEIEHER
jgi:hypothetical protein